MYEYWCRNGTHDLDGLTPYASPEEFLRMCRTCWGSAPVLTEYDKGRWYDAKGDLVLEREPAREKKPVARIFRA